MTPSDVKRDIIQALFNRGEYIRQVNDSEFRLRCPFCGDSIKNLNTGHLYMRINPDDNFPIVYNCFKCNEHGIVDGEVLSLLDRGDVNLKSNLSTMNKYSDKRSASQYLQGQKIIMFNYELPEVKYCDKIEYIERRLGITITNDDIKKMKIITSLKDFLELNKIKELSCDFNMANNIEKNYVGFLTFGSSYILFRDITNKQKYRWIKYPITKESKQCSVFYSIETTIDIFTEDKIIINLSEGIMDILSAYKNLSYNNPNTLNIAVCGKHYYSIIMKLVNMGFVGDNIELNIFADNDEKFNKNAKEPTSVKYFNKILKKAKYLYGCVNIYYNTMDKDIGIPLEGIYLEKYRL